MSKLDNPGSLTPESLTTGLDILEGAQADITARANGLAASTLQEVTEIIPDFVGAIIESTAATQTPERDELGEAVIALAHEKKTVDTETIELAVRMILEAVGENPSRSGLSDTPARVARFWRDFMEYAPGTTDTTFDQELVSDQMVAVSGMRVWSLCEHHLLPFYTDVSCGYIANGRVLGLSKFARIAHQCSHRLQTQENMAVQIADEIERITESRNVAVLCANGMHTCMTMRGIKTQGSMSNAVMRGVFRLRPTARDEFYNLIQRNR